MTPIRAVLFDMDGLLLDSERIALAVLADTARALGLIWSEAAGLGMVGLNERDSDAWLLHYFGADYPVRELRTAFNARYHSRVEQGPLPLKPGARDLLAWLEKRKLPCAVATSTRQTLALRKLQHAGLEGYFRAVIGGDQVARGKPAADIYLAAAAALGIAPEHALVLEDSDAGIAAALAAGCQALMVPDLRPPSAATLARGVPVLASLAQVTPLLAPVFGVEPAPTLS